MDRREFLSTSAGVGSFLTGCLQAPTAVTGTNTSIRDCVTEIISQTGRVRQMADADNAPRPGTVLAKKVREAERSTATCRYYSYALSQLLMDRDIRTRLRGLTFAGNRYSAHTLNEVWYPPSDEWIAADPTFGLVYVDPNLETGYSAEDLQAHVRNRNWNEIQYVPATDSGTDYAEQYYMDPVLLFLNLYPTKYGGFDYESAYESPDPYLARVPRSEWGQPDRFLLKYTRISDTPTVTVHWTDSESTDLEPLGESQYAQVSPIYSKMVIRPATIDQETEWTLELHGNDVEVMRVPRYVF